MQALGVISELGYGERRTLFGLLQYDRLVERRLFLGQRACGGGVGEPADVEGRRNADGAEQLHTSAVRPGQFICRPSRLPTHVEVHVRKTLNRPASAKVQVMRRS